MKRIHWLACASGLLACTFGCEALRQAALTPRIRQALWVNRYDYRSEEDVRTALRRAGEAGFDTVLFQVRGNATLAIPSRHEPWSREFGHEDPEFDPLAVAIDEGHRSGVRVHAWVNALPGWRGETAPPETLRQLYTEKPEWFLVDQFGRREPLSKGSYVLLNPCLPEVRAHIAGVCADIVRRYDVAGIHLDYVRFLEPRFVERDGRRVQLDYPRDARTLLLYREDEGRAPDDDPAAWAAWKRARIGELVREVRDAIERTRPGIVLTAAVFAPPRVAFADVLQDWGTWLRQGLLDGAFAMLYRDDDERFAEEARACMLTAGHARLWLGIGVYLHEDPDQTLRQMRLADELGASGIALYGYASFWAPAGASGPASPEIQLDARRRAILPVIRQSARR